MIIKIKGKCQWEGCEKKATRIACSRDSNEDADCYCEEHAREVAENGNPEYIVHCPNCGCMFGVN